MTKPTTLAWMTCALLTGHTLAHAQATADTNDRASPGSPIEITPYVSVGPAASTGVGAAVRWPIGARLGVELETELERSQTTAVAMALSLVYDLPAIGRVTPYVAGGIGLAPRGVVYFGPGGQWLRGTVTSLNVHAGGGIRAPVTERCGVRSDVRVRHAHRTVRQATRGRRRSRSFD